MAASKIVLSTPRLLLSLSLSLVILPGLSLAGCAPRDPVWDMPCAERPAQTVEVGTGEDRFEAADAAKLPIQYGSQGGQHIWMSVRLHGFGPEASLAYGIVAEADPKIVYSGPNQERTQLSYDKEEDASVATGLYGYLANRYDPDTQMELPGPSGQKVVLWAEVSDDCSNGKPVHAEAHGQVE